MRRHLVGQKLQWNTKLKSNPKFKKVAHDVPTAVKGEECVDSETDSEGTEEEMEFGEKQVLR